MAAKARRIYNCLMCGRDTHRFDKVCNRCTRGISRHDERHEQDRASADVWEANYGDSYTRDEQIEENIADEINDALGLE